MDEKKLPEDHSESDKNAKRRNEKMTAELRLARFGIPIPPELLDKPAAEPKP